MNAYLIHGNSQELIKEKVSSIVKAGVNVIKYDLDEVLIDDVIEEAAYLSLFAEEKFIIINSGNLFTSKSNEKDAEKLLRYFEHEQELSTLIFVTNKKLDMRKKIVKLFKNNNKILEIADLTEIELYQKLRKELENQGYNISDFSIKYIVHSSLCNYDIIMEELKKILLYKLEDKNISDDDVLNLVSKVYDDNIFNFTNSVIKKDIKNSFEILNELKLLKIEPIILLIVLANQYRLMYQSKVLNNKGHSQNEIAKMLKANPNVVWHALQNGMNYSEKELLNKIEYLADLDYEIKSGKIDKYIGFELFLLNV